MEDTPTLGSLLGHGRRSDELLVVSSLKKTRTLRRGTVIAHDTVNESILLQVSDKITRSDISEQDLLLMSENERLAYKIIQRYPKNYILRCIVVGALRDEGTGLHIFNEPVSFISEKTSEVRRLNPQEQNLIYNRGPLLMGTAVDGSPITFPINSLLQRHLSVVGMTGCGKSYLIGLLCEELTKHQAAILIIDPHNEYIPMAQSLQSHTNKMLYSVGRAVGLSTYTLDVKKISAQDFQHFTGMGEGSTSILDDVIHELRKSNPHYTLSDLLQNLETIAQSRSASEGMAAIWARNYLRSLAKTGFINTSEPPIKEMVRPNQLTVVAMSGVKEKIQQFVVTSILHRIFNARKTEEIPPLVIVVEEAHRFAPSAAPTSSSTIIRTLASEGRKFGTALVVVSQRPNRLDSTVLSQCVTNIVMKVKNPADLASIRESAENVTDEVIQQLPRFEKGEALVMGEAFPISLRFKVRSDRKTIHGGKNVDFQGRWREQSVQESVQMFEFPDEL